jgi:hypothetical protein
MNFGGRYEFDEIVKPINIEKILKNMDEIEVGTNKKTQR